VNKRFNSVEIEGDFAYCASHNFVYQPTVEEKKLYNAQPCFYTDARFKDGDNSYKRANLYWRRFKNTSLKKCIRIIRKCHNIPVGTKVTIGTSWYWTKKKVNPAYVFKVRKDNPLPIKYEISKKGYFKNFATCEFSKKLVDKLRENGFIVNVSSNYSFIGNMINTAAAYIGTGPVTDASEEGETAIANGHGKKIGFSSKDSTLFGYSAGISNILWDRYDEFDKWSRCCEIPKTTDIDTIIKILTEKDEKVENPATAN